MKNKKMIGIIMAVLAALTGGFFGIKAYRDSSRKAQVVPVSMLNQQYYSEGETMYGNVYDADTQNIYLQPTSIIERIYVSEGQEVSKGDPLISFDKTSQQLSMEIKQLEVESLRNQLAQARRDLVLLQSARPYVEPEPEPEPIIPEPEPEPEQTGEPEPTSEPLPEPIDEEQREEAWTALKRLDQNYETDDGMLHFLVTEDGLLYGSFLNELKKAQAGTMAVVEVREGNTKEGVLISAWTFNSSYIKTDYDDRDCWFVLTHDKAFGSGSAMIPTGPGIDQNSTVAPGIWQPDQPGNGGNGNGADSSPDSYDGMYTKEELARMIADKQNEIRDLDLSIRKAQLELKVMKEQMSDGVLYANKNGVVKVVGDPASPPQDGSPFMTVTAGSGLTVRSSVSELVLDKIKIGLPVTVTSYETGEVFEAKVKSVDVYPSANNMYGGGNPNASYYDFYVYADDAPNLPAYAWLEVRLEGGEASSGITLENAFIRSDAQGSYVMKEENGKLKKQYVRTGRSFYGYATEITEGLSMEDAITFPYGDGAKEGTSAEMSEDMGVFWQ